MMKTAVKFTIRAILVILLGGFLGATLARLSPGYGVNEEELDTRLNAESILALRNAQTHESDLVTFYVRYWGQLVRGDFGTSVALHEPIRKLVAERFPETLKSVGLGLALGWVSGLSLAVTSVMTRSLAVDTGASLLAAAVLSIPVAVLALFCVITRAPGQIVIGLVVFPKVFQYGRNLLARTFRLPHVLMARAKGLGFGRIILWHVLPVTAPQLFALAGVTVSIAFTAAIPVESLCDLPGIGQLAWKAALSRDLQLLVILTMIVTFITLLANFGSELVGGRRRGGDA
jgi:peptide/nickel transport system permease protein